MDQITVICAELEGTEQQGITEGWKEQYNDEIFKAQWRIAEKDVTSEGALFHSSGLTVHRWWVNTHEVGNALFSPATSSKENLRSAVPFVLARSIWNEREIAIIHTVDVAFEKPGDHSAHLWILQGTVQFVGSVCEC